MIRYINVKTAGVVETVDEVSSTDFESIKAFRVYLAQMIGSYRMIHRNSTVYSSQRKSKCW